MEMNEDIIKVISRGSEEIMNRENEGEENKTKRKEGTTHKKKNKRKSQRMRNER